jgi:hypothetical protein
MRISGVSALGLIVFAALLLGYCTITYAPRAYHGLSLSGRGPEYTFRYKLTLEVETPAGLKSASTVVELTEYSFSFPQGGVSGSTRGQSLYLDLGPGRKPLVALLTHRGGPYGQYALQKAYSGKYDWQGNRNPGLAEMIRHRGQKELAMADMPELVTFGDPKDPSTVEEVDPENIRKALGPDVWWARRLIELTDEPVTTGLEKKLPWLGAYYDKMLDGNQFRRIGSSATRANSLSTADFTGRGY